MFAYVLGADLAHRDELGEPRGGGGQVLEQPTPAEHPGQRARLELVPEPLLLGPLGLDGLKVQPLVRQRPEHAAEPRLIRHLAEHYAPATPRGDQPERGRDRRLSHSALARHEDEPLVQ
jgi:hypothetical protein